MYVFILQIKINVCHCRMIMESENRRREMAKVYNSYRAARSQYSIDEIPMPGTEEGTRLFVGLIWLLVALSVPLCVYMSGDFTF